MSVKTDEDEQHFVPKDHQRMLQHVLDVRDECSKLMKVARFRTVMELVGNTVDNMQDEQGRQKLRAAALEHREWEETAAAIQARH